MRNSKIIIASGIKIDRNYKNVLDYSEIQMLALVNEQGFYIDSRNNYSFIKKSINKIVTDFTYEECLQANYMAFQNPNYSNKWFFAWIDEVEYNSQNSTVITFTVDFWSTWYDNFNIRNCFVAREHVNDDTIGKHILNEDIGVGEPIVVYNEWLTNNYGDFEINKIALTSTYDVATKTSTNTPSVINGAISGAKTFFFNYSVDGIASLMAFIFLTDYASKKDAIQDIFLVPKFLVPSLDAVDFQESNEGATVGGTYYETSGTSWETYSKTATVTKNTYLPNYTPKNNKVYCYPFNYFEVTNNEGTTKQFRYEDFYGINCNFTIEGAFSIGGSVVAYPTNNNANNFSIKDFQNSIPLGKYPVCGWISDSYTNWLTQQAVNNFATPILAGMNAGVSALSGNISGAITSTASTVASYIDRFYQASLMPNESKGEPTADVITYGGNNCFKVIKKVARQEYLKVADDYFTRFGYKINEVKSPNITGRESFNYVEIGQGETVVYGRIPETALTTINEAFQNGVTIWHNHLYIGDYMRDNSISNG